MKPGLILSVLALAALPLLAQAESWTTVERITFEGRFSALYGDLLVVGTKNGSITVDVNQLDDASLAKVAQCLAAPSAVPSADWSHATSKAGKGLIKRLQILRDNKLVAFDPGSRPEPEFYLVYFGAYWCGPCRRFSPRLLTGYQQLKTIAADRFEVIFISDDTDSGEQLKYVREVNMPWPVLKYSAVRSVAAFEQWRARGIPCLVVLTREGDLLFHSYRKDEYLGAEDPLEKFSTLLNELAKAGARAATPNRHRLALAQHLQAAAGGDRALQPYFTPVNHRRLRTLAIPQVMATVTVDPKGHVADVEFSPKLDAVSKDHLTREAENWLFLPAIVKGEPQQSLIQLPILLPPANAAAGS